MTLFGGFGYFKQLIIFAFLFVLLTFMIKPFQLLGATDYSYWIQLVYNYFNFSTFNVLVEGFWANYFGWHFSPFWMFFSPFALFIKNPIYMSYYMNFIAYNIWFLSMYNIYHHDKEKTIQSFLIFFILFFSSITILFNYNLNYNGIHDVMFAVGFQVIAMYYLMIKNEARKAFFWFLPTLLIKEEYWLLLIFFNIAIYIKSSNKIYLLNTLFATIAFFLLYKILMVNLYNQDVEKHAYFYSYLFEVTSISELIKSIFSLSELPKRIFWISSFFLPFIYLINFRKISTRDWFMIFVLVIPTLGYTFLSVRSAMSNFLFDHYGLPIIGVVFIIIVKYGHITRVRLFLYLFTNMLLILFVLYMKQPWQYKYYMDEKMLMNIKNNIMYTDENTIISTDDRTGIYFANQPYMLINYVNKVRIKPDYIVLNTRYIYLSDNVRFDVHSFNRTWDYVNSLTVLKEYDILLAEYPFILFSKNKNLKKQSIILTEDILSNWDKKSLESNKWF